MISRDFNREKCSCVSHLFISVCTVWMLCVSSRLRGYLSYYALFLLERCTYTHIFIYTAVCSIHPASKCINGGIFMNREKNINNGRLLGFSRTAIDLLKIMISMKNIDQFYYPQSA